MVDSKSTLESAKCVQPVLSLLQKPSSVPKNSPSDFDDDNEMGKFQKFKQSIWWRHLVAGASAGVVSRTLTAPIDRVRIYSQVHHHSMSVLGVMKFLVREGGFLSLWRGNFVNVLKVMPESAIKFTIYEKVKQLLRHDKLRELATYERFVSGAVASGTAQTIIYPVEVLKVRLMLKLSTKADNIRSMTRWIYAHEGIRSFYRGYFTNIIGCVPYGGIELTIYEILKQHYTSYLALGESPKFFGLCICSAISSTLGQCCVYPVALVRTRLQSGQLGNTRLFEALREIFVREGIRGLYRGMVPNIYKVAPSVSINFVVYEYVSRNLGIFMS